MFNIKAGISICLLIITLTACSEVKEPSATVGFCTIGSIPNAQCQHEIAGQTITLYSSLPAMPEETAIDLYVDLPIEWSIQSSQLAGESMYMGTIPVSWTLLDSGRWLAKIRLGACTDPHMVWRLTMILNTTEGQATANVSFPVAAYP